MNIAKLNEIVKQSKLSKMELAKQCGITRVTLDNVLQGSDAKMSTIESLAKVLSVPVGNLFDNANQSNATANGHHSVAAIDSTIHISNDVMEERVKYLEKLLNEKERLINVYEKMMEVK